MAADKGSVSASSSDGAARVPGAAPAAEDGAYNDSWTRPPLSLLGWPHAVSEAVMPLYPRAAVRPSVHVQRAARLPTPCIPAVVLIAVQVASSSCACIPCAEAVVRSSGLVCSV